MEQDPGLNKMAFSFVRVAPRPGKPREVGLTIVADRGIAMNRVADLIDAGGEYIDFVKIGVPLNLLTWALSVALIPFAFPF